MMINNNVYQKLTTNQVLDLTGFSLSQLHHKMLNSGFPDSIGKLTVFLNGNDVAVDYLWATSDAYIWIEKNQLGHEIELSESSLIAPYLDVSLSDGDLIAIKMESGHLFIGVKNFLELVVSKPAKKGFFTKLIFGGK